MSLASKSVIEITRYPEASPMNPKTSMFDHWIPRNPSTTGTVFNNLINICAALILIAILALLELHIRHAMLHSQPAVMCVTNEAGSGISLHIPTQSNAVE